MAKTVQLIQDYNPNISRRELTAMLYERFFNLFCGHVEITAEGIELTQYEKAEIYNRIWNFGSFAIAEAKSTKLEQELEQSPGLVFCPYTVSRLSVYEFPLYIKLVPLIKSPIVDMRKKYTVGVDAALVFWSPYSRRHPGQGAKATARRYVRQIVRVLMTINTNLLLHKLPFVIDCDQGEKGPLIEALRQVFNDNPAVFVPSNAGNKLQGLKLDVPYIVDRLNAYVERLEGQYVEELGVDSAKSVAPGQDRLLLDEVNGNNNKIYCFRRSHIDTLNEGFEEAARILGPRLRARSAGGSASSVHEDIRNAEEQPPKEGGKQDDLS